MKWVIRIYAFILLAYAAWRTWDFLLHSLPAGETGSLLALFFLFATEVGLLLWHEISLKYTTTQEQHAVATGLIVVDFIASFLAGVADMILRQQFGDYTIPPVLTLILIYVIPGTLALNVAGVLFYLSNDGETQLDHAKRQLKFEITRQALRELQENKGAIAEQMKSGIYQRLKADVTGKYPSRPMPEPPAMQIAMQNPNGNNPEQAKSELPPQVKVNPTMPLRRGRPPIRKP